MFDALFKRLAQEVKAVPLSTIQRDAMRQQIDLQINGQRILLYYRNWVSNDGYSESRAGLWMEPGETSRLLETSANRVDEALKTGQYNDLFLDDPVNWQGE